MKKLWISFALVLVISFGVLGWIGTRIYQEMPPIPERVVATDGAVVIPAGDIGRGQNVWQSMGGMEVGSIWGHGSYVAPDWTADWLHREAMFVLDEWAGTEYGKPYAQLARGGQRQAARPPGSDLSAQHLRRGHRYASASRRCARGPSKTASSTTPMSSCNGHDAYAIPAGTVRSPERMRQFAAFIFWTSWAPSPTGPTTSSPTPTTGRTSRWSATGPPAKASCGPASASSCCWPASAPWSGGTPSQKPEAEHGTLPASDPLGTLASRRPRSAPR